jgi:hypothetical protein
MKHHHHHHYWWPDQNLVDLINFFLCNRAFRSSKQLSNEKGKKVKGRRDPTLKTHTHTHTHTHMFKGKW